MPRARRSLPDGRAVLGGLLVATATIGTWWLTAGAGRPAPASFVVTARTIDPGHRFEARDLRLVPMDLASRVRGGAFTHVAELEGSVSLGPLAEGALVQEAAIAPAPSRSSREISFAVETPWAVDGALRPGDRIDVFATTANDDRNRTTRVLAGAVVRHVSATGGGLGESTGLTITVAVDGAATLEGAVSALRSSELTVARATGVTAPEAGASVSEAHTSEAPSRTTTTTSPKRTARPTTTTTSTTVRSGR